MTIHSRRAVCGQILTGMATIALAGVDMAASAQTALTPDTALQQLIDGNQRANAKLQAGLLRQASPVLAEQIKQNRLKVAAAYYDLATGKVTMLE